MGAPVIEWLRPGVGYVPPAAASMRRLESVFSRRYGRARTCNSTYRDYNTQLSMWRAWQAYVAGTGPYPGHSRALHPDASMHCQGLADDTDEWKTPGYIDLAAEHGWIRTAADDPTEQHHFEYQEWRDQHRNSPAGGDAINLEEDDMSAEAEAKIDALYAAQFSGAKWRDRDGGLWDVKYGHFQVDLYTQTLVAGLQGQIAALASAVGKLAGGGSLDMEALKAEAKAGAKEALAEFRIEFPTPEQIADAVNDEAAERLQG